MNIVINNLDVTMVTPLGDYSWIASMGITKGGSVGCWLSCCYGGSFSFVRLGGFSWLPLDKGVYSCLVVAATPSVGLPLGCLGWLVHYLYLHPTVASHPLATYPLVIVDLSTEWIQDQYLLLHFRAILGTWDVPYRPLFIALAAGHCPRQCFLLVRSPSSSVVPAGPHHPSSFCCCMAGCLLVQAMVHWVLLMISSLSVGHTPSSNHPIKISRHSSLTSKYSLCLMAGYVSEYLLGIIMAIYSVCITLCSFFTGVT
eukprot:Gb_04316 [translate_table: standard]